MNNTGRWYLGRVLGNKAARITIGVVALAFAGIFWLLTETEVIEPSPTVAVIGVVIFVIVAAPIGWIVGGTADKKINPTQSISQHSHFATTRGGPMRG